jgi:hypothetical protein
VTPQEISESIKATYNRDLRKQIVKKILSDEKVKHYDYAIINQIFSYVLKSLGWDIAKKRVEWDETPLEIMVDIFPKIETTKWYASQRVLTDKNIGVVVNDK